MAGQVVLEKIVPQFEAVLASQLAVQKERAEREARAAERRAEDLRARARTLDTVGKARNRAAMTQLRSSLRESQAQAEEVDQPVTTTAEPYPAGQVQQTGSGLQQAIRSLPLAEVQNVGGRSMPATQAQAPAAGGVDLNALAQALSGGGAGGEGQLTETTTTVPVRQGSTVWMAPVRTRTRQTGMSPAQALSGALGVAQEQRLAAQQAQAQRAKQQEDRLRLLQLGATWDEVAALPPGREWDWDSFPEPMRRRLSDRVQKEYQRALDREDRLLRVEESRGRTAELAERRAQLELERKQASEPLEQRISAYQAAAQLGFVLTQLQGQAKNGQLRSAADARLSMFMNPGEPPLSTMAEIQKNDAAMATGAAKLSSKEYDEIDPAEVLTGLQRPAARIGKVVVLAQTPEWGRDPWESFDLENEDKVFDTMRVAQRTPVEGATPEQIEQMGREAEVQLQHWGLIEEVKESKEGYALVPKAEGPMTRVSRDMLRVYDAKLTLARTTGIPFSGPAAGTPLGGTLPQGAGSTIQEIQQGIMDLLRLGRGGGGR